MKQSARHKPALVYIAVNSTNGNCYVGITTHKDIRRRASEHFAMAKRGRHNGKFMRALREYGRACFEWFVLIECSGVVEAERKEIELIAGWKPEYNSTRGGNYRPEMSAAGRERLRQFHIGKGWHLGRRHSVETKEILSEKAKQQWRDGKGFRKPLNSGGRPVIRLDDGITFLSASEASRICGVAKSTVIMNCLGQRKIAGGMTFNYLDEWCPNPE